MLLNPSFDGGHEMLGRIIVARMQRGANVHMDTAWLKP
jgi:hypothetical protein